jgi:type IV pilus assembly protein PilB
MGVESFLLASTLNTVVAQRLVRRICADCREEYDPPKEVRDSIKKVVDEIRENKVLMTRDPEAAKTIKAFDHEKFKLSRGKGCTKCGSTGYKGRIGIFELLPMSDEIAHLTLENSPASKIQEQSISEGMLTLLEDGHLRVVEGSTTLEEVMRVAK